MDGSEARVACASAVLAHAFQVVKEDTNKGGIKILNAKLGRHFAVSLFGKMENQAETIAISRDCMRARLPLAEEAIVVSFTFFIALAHSCSCRLPSYRSQTE